MMDVLNRIKFEVRELLHCDPPNLELVLAGKLI